MKSKLALLALIISPVLLAACQPTTPPTTTAPATPTTVPTAAPTVMPTQSLNLKDINTELQTSVDDGGKADLQSLQQESKGL